MEAKRHMRHLKHPPDCTFFDAVTPLELNKYQVKAADYSNGILGFSKY